MLTSLFYEKEVTCPICLTKFNMIIIKTNKNIPAGKDADFRNVYAEAETTPYFYDVWVCPQCHYSAPKNIFATVNHEETLAIAEILSKSKLKFNPLGEREPEIALTCYKLAILCMSYRKVPISSIAGICLKTAWIHRVMHDQQGEFEYLHKAIQYYEEAYTSERFPIGGMNEIRLAYLLGELYRRVKDFQTAIQWFSKVVMSPMASSEPAILKMARDQWAVAKDEYDHDKSSSDYEIASTKEEFEI